MKITNVLGPFDHLSETQLKQILELWNTLYPAGLCYEHLGHFESFLEELGQIKHWIVLSKHNKILAWIMTFDRSGERWFSIIVSQQMQGQGLGRQLISSALEKEDLLNGWVVNHNNTLKKDNSPYLSPLPFYKKLGCEVIDQEKLKKSGISCVKIRINKDTFM